jgi:ribosome-associated protein
LDPREIALRAAKAADSKKATDIIIQHVSELLVVTDYFVIVTGANDRQVEAIADEVEEKLHEVGVDPIGREGYEERKWVLLDFGEVIVHVFQPDVRDFYRLETLWNDAPLVDVREAGIEDPEYSERIAKIVESATADTPGDADGSDD